ncbi:helix-turn-helix domain-containing protein, partial [Dubosiella newyorkensis]
MTIYRKTNQEKYRKDRFYAAYIQELRKYYEVPQKDLAKILHVSNSSLSRMESGQANMDVDLFNHAIEYFEKYDPDYKFNRKIAQLEEAEQWIDRCVQ